MAGHSKWANIQHRKGRQDEKRGAVFSKLAKEIVVAAKMGGGDVNFNPRLRVAVDKAKAVNMPKDKIDNAIKKGTGELAGVEYVEVRYEGYGIGGAAVMVDCLTDNKTRTVADVRHAFSKHGGNMGTDGCVAFQFKHCGQMIFLPNTDEAKLSDAAIEAADVVIMDDSPKKVTIAIKTAKKTISIVKQNIVFTIGVKILFLILGGFGMITMWGAVFADVGVSIIAILNALRGMK